MIRQLIASAFGALALTVCIAQPSFADDSGDNGGRCSIPASIVNNVQSKLSTVVQSGNGGFFTPNRMWSAIVDRQGVLCSVIRSNTDAWPGSRAIAIAKASTANDFSNNIIALSTANLYGPTQPGGSLYGLNNSNPYNPLFNAQGLGVGHVPGGIITFGGGVALYANGQVVGGLGVSGDTSCADHSVAYRMRAAAGLNGTPSNDNISYYEPAITSSPQVDPTQFKQPHCIPGKDVTP